jgi:hypothetical protein
MLFDFFISDINYLAWSDPITYHKKNAYNIFGYIATRPQQGVALVERSKQWMPNCE